MGIKHLGNENISSIFNNCSRLLYLYYLSDVIKMNVKLGWSMLVGEGAII